MASIQNLKGKWRAQVEHHGLRASKVCETEKEARLWAKFARSQLEAQWKRHKPRDFLADAGPDLVTLVPKLVLDACREIPHSQVDILEAAIPTAKASGIYFLIQGGDVAYVGQSVDVLHRIARHRREGRVFDAFSYIECEREDMDRLETLYIKAFVPAYNLSFGNHRAELKPLPGTQRRVPRTVPTDDFAG